MKNMIFLILILLLTFGCNSDSALNEAQPLENVLTLEISFGDDENKLPDEFILATPAGVAAQENGNILVSDESSLKVFSLTGDPLQRVGKKGQGPGEFEGIGQPEISHEGFITVFTTQGIYNVFDLDYEFIKKANYHINPVFAAFKEDHIKNPPVWIGKVISVASDSRIFTVTAMEDLERISHILMETPEEIKQVARYVSESNYRTERGFGTIPFRGETLVCQLPGKKIVHTSAETDKRNENGVYYYSLTVSNYDGSDPVTISRQFEPAPLPDDREPHNSSQAESVIQRHPYWPTLLTLVTDEKFIFAFQYRQNENGEFLTDIFNSENGDHISSAWFPFIPQDIEDGKAYFCRYQYDQWVYWRLSYTTPFPEQNTFPNVEVYSIDPAVYGK
ncbi:6-bladed beta-propeller [candidate division KSB1 bacterium]